MKEMETITVSIVEDDDEIRESLALLISGTPGFDCLTTYGDCESSIDGIAEEMPDVV